MSTGIFLHDITKGPSRCIRCGKRYVVTFKIGHTPYCQVCYRVVQDKALEHYKSTFTDG